MANQKKHYMRYQRSMWLGMGAIFATSIGCGGSQVFIEQNSTPKTSLTLEILHINDSHSHLDEAQTTLPFLTAAQKREAISVSHGGFARVTALMKQLATAHDNSLKIHAGDALVGDLYFKMSKGEAEAKLMNTVCFDSFTLGNHEFDNGDGALLNFLEFLDQSSSCAEKTKILSANVEFNSGSALHNNRFVVPYTIIEKQGQKIGLIGVTTAFKTKYSSRPDENTLFHAEVSSVQKYIDELREQGINKIIVQSHMGYQQDLAMAKQLVGVDVVIGGDSHSLLANPKIKDYGLTAEGDYPTQVLNKEGQKVCIGQAWQYAYVVGQLSVTFDADGVVQSCAGRPHILLANDFKRADPQALPLTSQEKQMIEDDIAQSEIFTVVQPDPTAQAVLQPFAVAKILFGQQKIATAIENLCLRRVPGQYRDAYRSALGDVCNVNSFNQQHGGDMQQLVAEAFLQQGKKYFKADFSLVNGGGVREDIAMGEVTVEKIYRVLAFNNTLVQLNMTGLDIKAMLEDAMDAVLNGQTGSYPYTGGLTWQVDLTQAKGQRITHVAIQDPQAQFQAINDQQIYRLITINFLADGQGSYHTLKAITGDRRIDVGLDYTEAFIQYLEDLTPSHGQKTFGRLSPLLYSTQKFIDLPQSSAGKQKF